MIKKYIGFLLAAAILGLLVVTVLHHDSYRSMVWDGDPVRSAQPAAPSAAAHTPVRQPVSAPAQPAESPSVEPAGQAVAGEPAADSLQVEE